MRGRTRQAVAALNRGLTPRRLLPLVLLLGALIGWGAGRLATAATAGQDQIVVGNTAGRLSVLLDLHGARVVIGGGDAQAELADLVERSSLPWDRRVHLLLVPAADTKNAVGALGLIERGQVARVVLLGEPGDDPLWDTMQRETDQTGTRIERLTGRGRVTIPGGAVITIDVPLDDDGRALGSATVSVERGALRIAVVDQPPGQAARADADTRPPALRVALRPVADDGGDNADVLVRPAPSKARDAVAPGTRYVADLERGARLTIRIDDDRLRLPLDRLNPGGAGEASR